jgi:myb proto-oncogene protein
MGSRGYVNEDFGFWWRFVKDMEVDSEELCCMENKQSTVASCSSASEGSGCGSGSGIQKSPGICSPTATSRSPSHR